MNSTNKEMWYQALDTAVPETYTHLSDQQLGKAIDAYTELIVKRCGYLVSEQQRTTGYTAHAKMLCEHFGIKYRDQDYYGAEQ